MLKEMRSGFLMTVVKAECHINSVWQFNYVSHSFVYRLYTLPDSLSIPSPSLSPSSITQIPLSDDTICRTLDLHFFLLAMWRHVYSDIVCRKKESETRLA